MGRPEVASARTSRRRRRVAAGDDELRPGRLGRQEDGGRNGDPVGDDEGADVVRPTPWCRPGARRRPPAVALRDHDQTGDAEGERREHERRAEDRPDADLVECGRVRENRIAMIGIIVSGRAVPTAARTDPTAPSARPSLRPNHSMPFVNSSAPARMTTNDDEEDQEVHRQRLSSPPCRSRRRSRPRRGSRRPPAPSLAPLAARTRSGRRRHAARASPTIPRMPSHRKPAGGRPTQVGDQAAGIERRRSRVERRSPTPDEQDDADRDERDRHVGADLEHASEGRFEPARGPGRVPANGVHEAPTARRAISKAVNSSTATNRNRRSLRSTRGAEAASRSSRRRRRRPPSARRRTRRCRRGAGRRWRSPRR